MTTGGVTMTHDQHVASDGYSCHVQHWSPAGTPRACVVAIHGIQSHAGWYEWSSERLAFSGYDVRFLDRRGSGQNDGQRGHADSARQLKKDLIGLLQTVREERDRSNPSAPVLLMSVSWGGKLAATVAAERPELLDGLLLLYPAVVTHVEPRFWQRAAILATTSIGLGRHQVAIPLRDPALFTGSEDGQAFIAQDSLALHRVSLSFLRATSELGDEARPAAAKLHCPTLVMLPGRDEIVDIPATRSWTQEISEDLRTVIEYPEARHTLEFDDCREQFVQDLIEWIECRCRERADNAATKTGDQR